MLDTVHCRQATGLDSPHSVEPESHTVPPSPGARLPGSRRTAGSLTVAVIAASLAALGPVADALAQLSVAADGRILRDGLPYRAIGVNYSDAFERVLLDPSDTSYDAGFAALGAAGIPFARIMATAFWPKHLAEFRTDREAYLEKLDGVVASAELHGVGLIPSLFWADFAVPDLVGEPRSAWGDPSSRTVAFMREYATTIVNRYKSSPAVWAWELGNEYSLQVDLPNASEWRPPIVPELGTPTFRSAADDLTSAMVLVALGEFARTVRAIDPVRPITSGHSLPRAYAESMRKGNAWNTLDSLAEFGLNLQMMNPPPVDMVSVHIYPHELSEQRFEEGHLPSFVDLVGATCQAARSRGQAVFVGEFGANDVTEGAAEARARQEELIAAILAHNVDLAAVWVFDRVVSNDANTVGWNITPTNSRSYLLGLIRSANERLAPRRIRRHLGRAGELPPNQPVGVDVPDLLMAYLGVSTTPTSRQEMAAILDNVRAAGITHVRFPGTPPFPSEMNTGNGWVNDPAAYWAAFDAVVADALAPEHRAKRHDPQRPAASSSSTAARTTPAAGAT